MRILSALLCVLMIGCNSSSVDDAIDLIEGPSRKTIDTTRMGVNAFANDSRFGSIGSQYREVRDVLGLSYVRILFAWNDAVQSSPGAAPNFSFYDDIADGLPSGVRALVVITGLPSWMSDPANWIDGNPRTTFVELWVRPVVQRYGANARIEGFQIWNEPNMDVNPDNVLLDMHDTAENYVELLARAYSVAKDLAPSKLVINAATTSINQDYPETLDYNRTMRDAGMIAFTDVWAIHLYGRLYENIIRSGGVGDFIGGLGITAWVTESGAQGPNSQLAYVEEAWPFFRERINGIDRIYYYQFTDSAPTDQNYGLRTLDPAFPISDLYVHLRDRNS